MEKDLSRGHLEELLREKTGEFKMYPTDRVWLEIYRRLHTRRKWRFIGGTTFALLITAGVFVLMQDNRVPVPVPLARKVSQSSTDLPLAWDGGSGTYLKPRTQSTLSIRASGGRSAQGVLTLGSVASTTFPGLETPAVADVTPASTRPATLSPMAGSGPILLQSIRSDSFLTVDMGAGIFPVSSGAKKLLAAGGKPKMSWIIHFEPSFSFRVLKSKPLHASNYGYLLYNNNGYPIGDLVNQRPSVGFEIGGDLLYPLTPRLTLRTGVQFNYSRYTSQAIYGQAQSANIALGLPGGPAQLTPMVTNYTNSTSGSGLNFAWIPNQRAQLSLPLGLEYRILQKGNVGWYIAGNFQPGYILNARSYVLTDDFKDYVPDPSLLRRWTMDAASETFVRINRGKVQLQIGPQFRYQLSPSFISTYPIKEHLYDAGIKIGITRNFR